MTPDWIRTPRLWLLAMVLLVSTVIVTTSTSALACAACYLLPDQLNQSFTQENPPAPEQQQVLPAPVIAPASFYERVMFQLDQIQRESGQRITAELNRLKSRDGASSLVWALVMGLAYGALHALGPGHGKVLVLSYFVGKNARPREGMVMGAQIAVFHVMSAVVAVVATEFMTRALTGAAPSDYHWLRLISYGLIAVCGAYMTVGALRRRSIQCAGCAHGHDHGHHQVATEGGTQPRLALSAAIGSIPCTGAILVLAFGLANDLVIQAIAIVAAISTGMALTLSAMGIAAIYSSTALEKRIDQSVRNHWASLVLRAIGGAIITLFGLGLMVAAG